MWFSTSVQSSLNRITHPPLLTQILPNAAPSLSPPKPEPQVYGLGRSRMPFRLYEMSRSVRYSLYHNNNWALDPTMVVIYRNCHSVLAPRNTSSFIGRREHRIPILNIFTPLILRIAQRFFPPGTSSAHSQRLLTRNDSRQVTFDTLPVIFSLSYSISTRWIPAVIHGYGIRYSTEKTHIRITTPVTAPICLHAPYA